MKTFAVITGDIIKSTRLDTIKRKNMIKGLEDIFKSKEIFLPKSKTRFEIFRGDSFQGITEKPSEALWISLKIILKLKKDGFEDHDNAGGARIAIGIGEISFRSTKIIIGEGTAFRHSGHALDSIRKNERIKIITPWNDINEDMLIYSTILDKVINNLSKQQAEVIYDTLDNKSQKELSRKYKISQPAISQRLEYGSWLIIERILNAYKIKLSSKLN